MNKSIRIALVALLLAPALLALAACKSDAQTGALIGAGAGALGGYVIGNEMDK
jgi:Glycine zipper